MPKPLLYGQEPESSHEDRFAELLQNLEINADNKIHVWFTRILGTRDIDVVLMCNGVGLFAIELKSFGLRAIRTITADAGMELEPSVPRSTTKPAWHQAMDAADSLRNRIAASPYYASELGGLWISPVAAFFNISRAEFREKFGSDARNEHALTQLESGMIFCEDLTSGEEFVRRLRFVKNNPLYRARPERDRPHLYSDETARTLENFIHWRLEPAQAVTPTDIQRISVIEREEERGLDKVDLSKNIICTGYAGTGKTILGLQAALRRRVPTLFTCFNKVLATDIRRLTSMSASYQTFPFDVYDINDLVRHCEQRLRLKRPYRTGNNGAGYDTFETGRIEALIALNREKGSPLSNIWEMIIVDESQDISDPSWQLLEQLIGSQAILYAVHGKHQQLYRTDVGGYLSEVLPRLTPQANILNKRRVFRTTSETFLLGQLFADTYPSRADAVILWRKHELQYRRAMNKEEQRGLEFELSRRGASPKIIGVTDADAVATVAGRIRTALEPLKQIANASPSDILILVPFTDTDDRVPATWLDIARNACKQADVEYIDYTKQEFRRVPCSPNQVRIATYHSARGIEALHSIVLGFDSLSRLAKDPTKAANLGYIVLTRSVFETDVVYLAKAQATNPDVMLFLNDLIEITGF